MVTSGWEPINTVPRDGADYLFHLANGYITRGRLNSGKYFSVDSMGPTRPGNDTTPTHWMPLPPKPKEKS